MRAGWLGPRSASPWPLLFVCDCVGDVVVVRDEIKEVTDQVWTENVDDFATSGRYICRLVRQPSTSDVGW